MPRGTWLSRMRPLWSTLSMIFVGSVWPRQNLERQLLGKSFSSLALNKTGFSNSLVRALSTNQLCRLQQKIRSISSSVCTHPLKFVWNVWPFGVTGPPTQLTSCQIQISSMPFPMNWIGTASTDNHRIGTASCFCMSRE